MDGVKRYSNNPWTVYEEETPHCRVWKCKGDSLQDELKLEHLQLLQLSFTRQITSEATSQGKREKNGIPGGPSDDTMGLEEFRTALLAITGLEHWASKAEELFNEVDIFCRGRVGWEEVCTYLLQCYRQRDSTEQEEARAPRTSQPLIRHCLHSQREPIVRMVAVSQPPPLRFITVSKRGTLTVWNRSLHIVTSVQLSGDPEEEGNRKKFRGLTTDAVYMANVHKIAVATMNRELRFFDISASSYIEEFHLCGLSNAVTAMCYWYDTSSPGNPSLLVWGDDKGSVNILRFLCPHKGLFDIPFTNQTGPQRVYLQDVCINSQRVSYQHVGKIHEEPINRIQYRPGADLVVTSSESATSSVVLVDVSLRNKSYVWKINKGVTCFDFCASMGLLVTSGVEPVVRVWTCYVTACPVASLEGHRTAVLDVAIHQGLSKIFSYSKDAVLKIWDIQSQQCVRSLQLKFPYIVAGQTPEHGNFPLLLLQTPLQQVLVSCRDYLGLLRLDGGASDDRPVALTSLLYNSHLKQVVTACANSSLAMWDIRTGSKILEMRNTHGEAAITCLALDTTQRLLVTGASNGTIKTEIITGASNGTIKVWNLLNGHNLHKLEAVSDTEVTGVICNPDNHLLAVGWSRQIAQYHITDPNETYVRAEMPWKASQQHQGDILAVDHCPLRGLLATGSFDGEIIIWDLDNQRPVVRLANSKSKNAACPVDKLMFLQHHAECRQWRERPLLISSQAGYVCCWMISGSPCNHGQFYAPNQARECVLGLSSDQENKLLVTSDTAGFIQVWDISQHLRLTPDEGAECRPLLLHSWRAHGAAAVGAELLTVHTGFFVASASADGVARLWTVDGGLVGDFGRDQQWNLSDPSTYQRSSTNQGDVEEKEDDQSPGSSDAPDDTGRVQSAELASRADERCREDYPKKTEPAGPDEDLLAAEDQAEARSVSKSPTPMAYTTLRCTESDQYTNTQTSLGTRVAQELQRKMTARKDRQQTFGDIDVKKIWLINNICTPFQALKLPELSRVEDMPTRPELLFSRATELSSPLLSSQGSDRHVTEEVASERDGVEGSHPSFSLPV
ncbi:WD repeat-containing protein on Y chromosome isoform X2 [Denticeps clupeoides]|uniref:WD repeat-containing protein on Y chromosome isoform X2 n=1 Tax=Denticeps clupeoides TaxID=299321 RepID=UPI0010A47E26|nr:WD repeat-containing protein on Y chromosome-like isoform X2 [Denticeps clupeoides]